jgi:catechol 2,3-dioxygenase-like lactoylglutathione lyase family enzyme
MLQSVDGRVHIAQVSLTVDDLDAAVAFYRDLLGMPFLFRAPTLALFECGGTRLLLGVPEGDGQAHHSSIIYFRVADIDASYAAMQLAGVPFDDAPHIVGRMGAIDVWMAFFRDPSGNILAITSEVPVG